MTMRGKFTAPGTSIHYYVVEFDTTKLSRAPHAPNVRGRGAGRRCRRPARLPGAALWTRARLERGCCGALVPAHRLKLALDFPIQVAASREKSFTGYSAAFLRSKRAARAEAGATVEATVEATVASAAVETARRKSTRRQVVCAMLRTANLEESDRRRAVRACAPLHENDSDTRL